MRLSIIWRIMEIEEGITASADNTLRDHDNSLDDTKAKFNNRLLYAVSMAETKVTLKGMIGCCTLCAE